jgi:hypothetical protein
LLRNTHNHIARQNRTAARRCAENGDRLSLVEIVLLVLLVLALAYAGYRAIAPRYGQVEETATVRVTSEQTLWELASRHKVPGATTAETIEIIKRVNGMTESALRVGQTVQVPVSDAELTAMASR